MECAGSRRGPRGGRAGHAHGAPAAHGGPGRGGEPPSPTQAKTLAYGGGVDGIGVTNGAPKVYLVFYGHQWGTQGTDASGNLTLSGDAAGGAPLLQKLFKGLGTGGETWSGVMTQYCDGVGMATGATTCPATATHVGYPTGGALAGVWYDSSVASPASATANQLGQEAVTAAAHFGNTTPAQQPLAQYVILSPTGTHPDGFNTSSGQFCAWHDWNGDPYVGASSAYGDIAFTNMPYVIDMGTSCGQNFVNGRRARRTATPSSRATSTPRRSPTRTRPAAGPTSRPAPTAARRTRTSARGSPPARPAARATSRPSRAPSRCRRRGATTPTGATCPTRPSADDRKTPRTQGRPPSVSSGAFLVPPNGIRAAYAVGREQRSISATGAKR